MRTIDRMNDPAFEALPEVNLPKGMVMQTTPAELRIRAKLGSEMAEPTIMTTMIAWAIWQCTALLGMYLLHIDVGKWEPLVYWGSLSTIGLFVLLPAWIDRVFVRADHRGLFVGMRPVPMNGYPFYRHIPAGTIAAIYVTHYELTRRFRAGSILTFELHALTRAGESVCLLKRLPETAARELVPAILNRVKTIPQVAVPLRGRKRSTTERATDMSGIPAWLLYLGILLIGVEQVVLPYVRVRNWEKVSATVIQRGHMHPGGLGCRVQYATARGSMQAWVDNLCSPSVRAGDVLTLYYPPQHPDLPQRIKISWLLALPPILLVALAMYFVFDHPGRRNGRRILYRDRFKMRNQYWKVGLGDSSVSNGVLTVRASARKCEFPFAAWVSEPGAIEVQVSPGPSSGERAAAGILFGYTAERDGTVFAIMPASRTALARKIARDRTYDIMQAVPVPQIQSQSGAWNALRIEISEGRAQFFVNGAPAGSIEYHSPLGGGMVGLYAEFDGSLTSWNCSDFVVME